MNYIMIAGPYGGDMRIYPESVQAVYRDRQAGTWLIIGGQEVFSPDELQTVMAALDARTKERP